MATREGKTALNERERRVRSKKLNGSAVKTSPVTEREQRLWRDGLLIGSARMKEQYDAALEEMRRQLDEFHTRIQCRGVELNPPKVFSTVHPMARWKARK